MCAHSGRFVQFFEPLSVATLVRFELKRDDSTDETETDDEAGQDLKGQVPWILQMLKLFCYGFFVKSRLFCFSCEIVKFVSRPMASQGVKARSPSRYRKVNDFYLGDFMSNQVSTWERFFKISFEKKEAPLLREMSHPYKWRSKGAKSQTQPEPPSSGIRASHWLRS